MSGFHPGHVSFLLQAASDTLPTVVNLRRWCIQSDVKCTLCDSIRPTTAHILGDCPVALTQQKYTHRHDQVLYLLASKLKLVTIHLSMFLLTFRVYELVKHLKPLFHLPY